MRIAAARLGLGLAAAGVREKIRSSSPFMRRSSSLAAAAEADVWKKKGVISSGSESQKSLYLCFREKCFYNLNQIVRPIRLSGDAGKEEQDLPEVAYKTSEDTEEWRSSCRFGSQILFPSGPTHISRVDTSTRPIKFENFTTEFSSPKIDPVLVELNGKLYCIDKDNPYRLFEVLDDFKWRALDMPPFSKKKEKKCTFYTSILDQGGNKILAWEQGKAGVFWFDITKPENGWEETPFTLGNLLPFLGYHRRPPIFIHNHHTDLGDFYLVFSYDYRNKPLLLSPFILHNFQTFEGAGQFRLPTELYFTYLKPDIYPDYEFVHLGGQKVCLVLNKFFPDNKTGILLLIAFEYDVDKHPRISIKILWTRRIQYCSEELQKRADDKEVYSVHLTGAFAL